MLPFSELKPGDIVVTSGNSSWQSRLVVFATQSDWTHVFLIKDAETLLESNFPKGVREQPLKTRLAELQAKGQVWRVMRYLDLEPEQLTDIIAAAERMVGRKYDILQAVIFGLFRVFIGDGPKRVVCSRYITEAFKEGGIDLFPDSVLATKAGRHFFRYKQLQRGWTIPQDLLEFANLEEIR